MWRRIKLHGICFIFTTKIDMKHCYITPIDYLLTDVSLQSEVLLVLSHLLDEKCENQYAKNIAEWKRITKREVILDNGLYENHVPESMDTLMEKAMLIEANSVFAPDYLYDRAKTKQALLEFIELRNQLEEELGDNVPKVNYVIQANTYNEYIEEFVAAQDYDINMIGLSILSIPYCFKQETFQDSISINRMFALQELDHRIKNKEYKKPAHMLGLGESLIDLKVAKQFSWVKSNDSCLAFWTACKWEEYCYDNNWVLKLGKPEDKLDFNLPLTKDYDSTLALQNIKIIKSI